MKELKLTDKELDTLLWWKEFYNEKCIETEWNLLGDKLEKRLQHLRGKRPIQVSSRKAKGRKLQQWIVEKIAKLLNYEIPKEKDLSKLKSREMGQAGTDVMIADDLRSVFPFAVECKNQEQVALVQWIEQAKNNITETLPYFMLVIHNKKIKDPVICIPWEGFSFLYHYKPLTTVIKYI